MEIVLYPAVTWYFLGIHDDLNHVISLNNEFFTVNLYKNQNIYFSLQGTNQAQIHTGFHSFTEICWICQNHRQTQKRRLRRKIQNISWRKMAPDPYVPLALVLEIGNHLS